MTLGLWCGVLARAAQLVGLWLLYVGLATPCCVVWHYAPVMTLQNWWGVRLHSNGSGRFLQVPTQMGDCWLEYSHQTVMVILVSTLAGAIFVVAGGWLAHAWRPMPAEAGDSNGQAMD